MLDVWYWMPDAGGLVLETRSWLPGSGSERPLRKSGKLLRVTEGPLRGSARSLRGYPNTKRGLLSASPLSAWPLSARPLSAVTAKRYDS